MLQRYDRFQIKAEKTDEGFIRDTPIIARSGILKYLNADGSTRLEYRPPEEAFDEASLDSVLGKPITLGHPGMVSSGNAKDMPIIGAAVSKGMRDGNAIRADVSLFQLPTDARELSCGYTLDLEETPGTTPDGQHYDAIQRNVRINHIAIVPKGRAGIARLNMDGDEIIEEPEERKDDDKMAEKTMTKVRLDSGLEYDAAPEVAVYIENLQKDMEQMRSDSAEAEKASKKAADEAQAKIDSLTSDLEKVRKDAEDAEKAHKENFDSAVKARVELLDIAKTRKVENADSMSNDEIKIAVIKAVRGDSINLDGKSADYIAAAFDLCKAEEIQRNDAMAEQRKDTQTHSEVKQDENVDAYQKLIEAERNAYMKGRE